MIILKSGSFSMNLKKSVEHTPAKNIQHKLDGYRVVMISV
jgi:hypothetical protein